MLKLTFHLLNVNFSIYLLLNKFHPHTCTVNWFYEHLYSKLVLCIMSIPCTFFSLVMSVPCTFFLLVMSVPCTFLLLVMSISVWYSSLYIYSTGVHITSLQYTFTQNQCTVQIYIKLIYSTCVHKTCSQYICTQNNLKYMWAQNQFTVHLYIKLI